MYTTTLHTTTNVSDTVSYRYGSGSKTQNREGANQPKDAGEFGQSRASHVREEASEPDLVARSLPHARRTALPTRAGEHRQGLPGPNGWRSPCPWPAGERI